MKTILTADWGPALRRLASTIVPVLCFIYTLGYALGRYIHQANNALAGVKNKELNTERNTKNKSVIVIKNIVKHNDLSSIKYNDLRRLAKSKGIRLQHPTKQQLISAIESV